MKRRQKGDKRYASQRERRFTEPLIREDELELVREAKERMFRVGEEYKEEDPDDGEEAPFLI